MRVNPYRWLDKNGHFQNSKPFMLFCWKKMKRWPDLKFLYSWQDWFVILRFLVNAKHPFPNWMEYWMEQYCQNQLMSHFSQENNKHQGKRTSYQVPHKIWYLIAKFTAYKFFWNIFQGIIRCKISLISIIQKMSSVRTSVRKENL